MSDTTDTPDEENQAEETRWEDTGDICSDCDYNGKHLIVDAELLYCGRCHNLIREDDTL